MTEFCKKHKKKIIVVSFLFFLFFGGFLNLKYNLPKTVEVLTGLFVGPKFKSSKIIFDKDKIVVKDFVLQDKKEVIISSPEVEILYDDESLKNYRIKEIIMNGGQANITRRKNGDINIVAAFTGSSDDSKEEPPKDSKKEEKYDPGIGVPIDKITGINVTTTYRDLGYRLPIEKTAYDTNGYLTFSKTKGLNLHFVGKNKAEIYDFAFTNYKEPYWMRIKLSNIGVTTELAQYGYDGEEVSYDGGLLNMDLIIAESGMLGNILFDGVDVRYKDLDDTVKNVSGAVDFKPEGIFLNASGLVFGKPEKFTLSYKDEELNIDFNLKNIKQKDLEKLSYLQGINLPFKGAVVDDVKFNLNMKKELKVTIDALVNKLNMDSSKVEKLTVKFIYDNNGIHIDNLNGIFTTLDEKKKESIKEKFNLSLDMKDDDGQVKFDIKNINNKRYVPDFSGDGAFKLGKESIVFGLNSNIISLKGEYQKSKEKLLLKDGNKYSLEYDLKSKKLVSGEGKIPVTLLNNRFLLDYSGENNILKINRFSIFNEIGINHEFFKGTVDLNSMSYDLEFPGEKFYIQDFMTSGKESILEGKIKGFISGSGEKNKTDLEISDLTLNYLGEIKNINGKFTMNKDKNTDFAFSGEIGNIKYKEYSLQGLRAVFRMKDNLFEVKTFNNDFVKFKGVADLNHDTLDMKAKIKALPLTKFNVDKPDIFIGDVQGFISGKISDPQGRITINDVQMEINNGQPILVKGGIDFNNRRFYTDNLKINNTTVKGEYDIEERNYWMKANIIEENIGRYYGDTNLKYRVIGTINVKGQEKNIHSSLKSTLDKMYIQGNHLPNVYVEANYDSDNLLDGILKVNEITFSNSDLEEIAKLKGNFDLKEKKLVLNLNRQEIPLIKLKEYIPLKNVKGNIVLEGNVGGTVPDLKYNLSIKSDKLEIENVEFNKIITGVSGDLHRVNLDEFSFKYLENLFYSKGNYNIENGKYIYSANSKRINLGFLNIFLNKYDIDNINGDAIFDLQLTNYKNSGFLTIKDFNLEKKDLFLKLTDFNSTILLAGDKLSIQDLKGKINHGEIGFKGYITLPTLKDITENPYFYENLKYEATLNLKNFDYKYDKYFNIDLNTDLTFKNQTLLGQIEIIKGEIFEIPSKKESIFTKIKKFLFSSASKTVNDSESLGKDFKIETEFANSINVNVGIKIRDGIKLDIDTLVPMVSDVKGKIEGSGIVSGNNGKYLFLGNVEAVGASLSVNDNTFVIDRALVAFNDKKVFFPKINPSILVDASVEVKNDKILLALNGALDNLQFNISSRNGSSSGNLNSFLMGDGDGQENNDATAMLLSNILGGQVTQLLKPISNLVKNTLGLSKFRIASNVVTEQTGNAYNTDTQQSRFKFGAVLEAEDNIYKDKIWWVARATLLEEDSEQNNNKSTDNNGAFKDYDFSIDYRFDYTKSIGIGVGKLPEDMKNTSNGNTKKNLNYHIDFKFQKKYDNLLDIFINK